jgi:hypothetical protein
MIIKHNNNFFIQCDVVYPSTPENYYEFGVLNFWIDDVCLPGKGVNITFNSVILSLVRNIPSIKNLEVDLGDVPLENIDFCDFDNPSLVWLDTCELFQYGFGLILGFNKDQERIFYTTDYEKTYTEIVLPKGTLLATLESLSEKLSCYL